MFRPHAGRWLDFPGRRTPGLVPWRCWQEMRWQRAASTPHCHQRAWGQLLLLGSQKSQLLFLRVFRTYVSTFGMEPAYPPSS